MIEGWKIGNIDKLLILLIFLEREYNWFKYWYVFI